MNTLEDRNITIVAGSFGHFHKGHRKLLQAAADTGNYLIIGLTSDDYGKRTKNYNFPDFERRKKPIVDFLDRINCRYEIKELRDNTGDSTTNPQYRAIVVSRETEKNGKIINEKRRKNGLDDMEIITVDLEIAQDYFPISSRRIESGEIDEEGVRKKPIRIGLCTNLEPIDLNLSNIFQSFFHTDMIQVEFVKNIDDSSGVEDCLMDMDYSFKFEFGVFYHRLTGTNMSLLRCLSLDRYGTFTIGESSSIMIPETVHDGLIRNFKVNQEMDSFIGNEKIRDMVIQSLDSAMFPRKIPWKYKNMDYFKDQP